MPARCLSVHARYRCRHTGECCSGVFAIPAEPRVRELVEHRGLGAGRRAGLFVTGHANLFRSQAGLPAETGSDGDSLEGTLPVRGADPAFVAARPDGRCVFWDPGVAGSCLIHREAGADALPSACRHFPRVFLRDGRGSFLSLSHFCPTAAGLLFDERPLSIVDVQRPPAIPEPVESFEAEGALPPLLTPGLLTDLDGYGAWERECIGMFARADLTHVQALDRIETATERVRSWNPCDGPLARSVSDAFRRLGNGSDTGHRLDDRARVELLNISGLARAGCRVERLPGFEAIWVRGVAASWPAFDRAIACYLAAKLFGHRIAYECRGLRSIVEWLRVALALLRNEAARVASTARAGLTRELFVEAVRATDLALVHRLDTAELARRLAVVEGQP